MPNYITQTPFEKYEKTSGGIPLTVLQTFVRLYNSNLAYLDP